MPKTSRPQVALTDILEVEGSCPCINIRKAARVVTQIYDAALAPSGLRSTQFSVLLVVAGLQPVSMSDLAERVVMDRTTLTRNLVPLLDAGLISTTAGSDRRRREVELTDAGRRTLAHALQLWKKVQAQTVSSLGEGRLAAVLGSMTETVSVLGGER
jgi:DNA-binding MarR family transcriptional regulator